MSVPVTPLPNRASQSRFSWVRRLVLGPLRPHGHSDHVAPRQGASQVVFDPSGDEALYRDNDDVPSMVATYGSRPGLVVPRLDALVALAGDGFLEDMRLRSDLVPAGADNVLTVPVKLLLLLSSRKLSILGEGTHIDLMTMATLIAPSGGQRSATTTAGIASLGLAVLPRRHELRSPPSHAAQHLQPHLAGQDTLLIVTLALSTRRLPRRRSQDLLTNALTTGIAPALIMERVPAANPLHQASLRTSTYAVLNYLLRLDDDLSSEEVVLP